MQSEIREGIEQLGSQSLAGLLECVVRNVGSTGLFRDWLVVEASLGWSDSILLSHFEVLAEVLVTAPPVEMDHAQSLVPSDLMEVRVANVVLDTVDGESTVSVAHGVPFVGLSNPISPVLNHSLLSVLLTHVEEEGAHEMESHEEVKDSESVLSVEDVCLPVEVTKWIFVEARDVLVGSPSLGIISWLVHLLHELCVVAISLFGQSTRGPIRAISILTQSLTVRSYQHVH